MSKSKSIPVEPLSPSQIRVRSKSRERHENGMEILDPVPMQPPLGYRKQPSMMDTVRAQVQAHHRRLAEMEPETFEESDDFDVGDEDELPHTRWENDFEPSVRELQALARQQQQDRANAIRQAQETGQYPQEQGDLNPQGGSFHPPASMHRRPPPVPHPQQPAHDVAPHTSTEGGRSRGRAAHDEPPTSSSGRRGWWPPHTPDRNPQGDDR